MEKLTNKLANILNSRWFYWGVVAFLAFEALWIVFSAKFPMAFDEDFHLGVIKIYSQNWLPFLPSQPEGAEAYGALATDPSYLYHYLMSFPYRFISWLTDNQAAQVIFLRIINASIFVAGVVLFRKVLLRAKTSPKIVSVATLLFALIPTVPLLAGQINYDSLMLLSLAGICWLVLLVTEDLKDKKVNLLHLALLTASLMLACLVKYAFLPLAFAVFVYVVVMFWVSFRNKPFLASLKKSYKQLSVKLKAGLLVILVISTGFFAQRYVANMVRYHDPVPDCGVVLDLESCMQYGPWARNYRYAAKGPAKEKDPLGYTWQWAQGMHYRLFFMITGPPKHTNFAPSPLPSGTAIVILLFGVVSLVFFWRRVFVGRPFVVFLLLMSIVYTAILWLQNYSQYLETGRLVAINGRYFIPLLLPLAAVIGRGLSIAFGAWSKAKVWVAVVTILLFVQGGGIFSFILRSNEVWYWPNNTVIRTNQTAQKILDPVIFEGPTKY